MGYARILSGGPDGRYSIELDYGQSYKTALLAALSVLLAQLDTAIAQNDALIAEADAEIAAQMVKVEEAQAAVIASSVNLAAGSPRPDTFAFKFELKVLSDLRRRFAPLRIKRDALNFERAQTLRRVAYWTTFNPVENRNAWCVDLTEDAAIGSYVATADIPGESNLIVLAPGCRAWAAGDGILSARELMSPPQAFLNAAILPGWQKFKPTYRWGTCVAKDDDANTMTVELSSQKSSAQSLGINQADTLTNVPVEYMTCNSRAFEIDDRVVVQFVGQAWVSPKVIGFLDNPKPCAGWILRYIDSVPSTMDAIFESLADPTKFEEALAAATSIDVDFRVDRGSWTTAVGSMAVPVTSDRTWRHVLNGFGFTTAGFVITLFFPGSTPPELTGSAGPSAHLRFSWLLNSDSLPEAGSIFRPFFAIGSTVEVRIRVNGLVFANIAVRSSFAPFAVDSGATIPDTLTDATQLNYVRFSEDGT